jgi:small subunit ribosomal protein S10
MYTPRTIEKYTVLRSPHVDKKARDQFERKTYKRCIKVVLSPAQFKVFSYEEMFKIIQYFAVGVEFKITYVVKDGEAYFTKENE